MSIEKANQVQQHVSDLCAAIGAALTARINHWTRDLEAMGDEELSAMIGNELGQCMAAHMMAAMELGRSGRGVSIAELIEMMEQTVMMGKDLAELHAGYKLKATTEEEAQERAIVVGFKTSANEEGARGAPVKALD